MKKIIPLLIIFVLISSCKTVEKKRKPKVEFERYELDSISLNYITFLFHLRIINPYDIDLNLNNISCTGYLEEKRFFKSRTSGGLKLRAGGSEISTFKVKLKYTDLINIIKDYPDRDYAECVIELDIPLPSCLKDSLPFNYKFKTMIPVIKPKIRIVNFRIKGFSFTENFDVMEKIHAEDQIYDMNYDCYSGLLSGAVPLNIDLSDSGQNIFCLNKKKLKINKGKIKEKAQTAKENLKDKIEELIKRNISFTAEFDIEIINETKFMLRLQSLNYRFYAGNEKIIEGSSKKFRETGNKSVLSLSLELNTKSLGETALKALAANKLEYLFTGSAMVKVPEKIRKTPLKLDFNMKGRFQF